MIRARLYLGQEPADCRLLFSRAEVISAILAEHGVDGATVIPATGLWQGALESSTVIELLSTTVPVAAIAESLRAAFNQTCVLYTVEDIAPSGAAWRPM